MDFFAGMNDSGAYYRFDRKGHRLVLAVRGEDADISRAVENGPIRLAVYGEGTVVFLLISLDEGESWQESPYSWHLVPREDRMEAEETPWDDNILFLYLWDLETRSISAKRILRMSENFCRELFQYIEGQQLGSFNGQSYAKHLNEIWNRYDSVEMADLAAAVHQEPERKKLTVRWVVWDWGDTLMRDFPDYNGPMVNWPKVEVLDGVEETVKKIFSWAPCAVASGAGDSDRQLVAQALKRGGLYPYFSRIYTSHELGQPKESPDYYRNMAACLGVAPEECLMVGNHYEKDIEPALAAGMQAVWLTDKDMEERMGLYLIRDIRELPRALEDMTSSERDNCKNI